MYSATKRSCVCNSNGESKKIHKILESVKWGAILSVCMCVQSLIVERRSLSFGVCFGSHTLCALLRGNCRNGHHRFLWLLLLLWLCTKPFVYELVDSHHIYVRLNSVLRLWSILLRLIATPTWQYNIVYIIITLWVPFLYVVDIVLRYFKAATVG